MNTGSCDQQIPMKSLVELRGINFIIPSQQRGYKWTGVNISELLKDFLDFIGKGESKKVYCLQPLALVPKGNDCYSVLDGQQRLTTLFLLFKVVFGEELFTFTYERDTSCSDDEVKGRWELLHNITDTIDDSTIDTYFITNAFKEIKRIYAEMVETDRDSLRKLLLADSTAKSVQVIWYEVEEYKSHETFRNLNSGKIPLSNTELIKALFLNRVSGLKDGAREQAAVLFEEMEKTMRDDRFWFMFNSEDQREGQSRLDFIFNLVAQCSPEDYNIDPRWSFRMYFDKNHSGKTLEDKWKEIRHTYLRLRDMYEDPYIYHYVGFLTYCKERSSDAKSLLVLSRKKRHSEFIEGLRSLISSILMRRHESLSGYSYADPKPTLRRLFLIYNIETILFKYEEANRNSELALNNTFERFPFELLHRQSWDIEHIASKTDNDFSNADTRRVWLESIKADLGDEYVRIDCAKSEAAYMASQKKEDFNVLYSKIMKYCEAQLGDSAIPDSVPDDSVSVDGQRKDKNQLGNLTLLDSHTNRSFHNSLFPRKRKIVLVAGGLQSEDSGDDSIRRVFIPVCTRQCFTKSYRRTADVNLNAWTQPDADAYFDDIELKLNKYFK